MVTVVTGGEVEVHPGPARALTLEAEGLRKRYGERTVVDVERLEVRPGEVFAVLGPNGAGKTTLFRLLALLERPDAGRIRYNGREVDPKDLAARRQVACVFQRPLLFRGRVAENVAYGLRLRRRRRAEATQRAREAMALVGIDALAGHDVRTLSGGELQRVALARALVLEPEILFLDEPTSNLDSNVRRRFREDLQAVVRRLATTVVLITHDHNEVLALADRVVVLRDGRIVQEGTPDEVFDQPRDAFVADFVGIETVWHGQVVESREGLATVRMSGGLCARLVADVPVGAEVAFALRPEDVVLAPVRTGPASATSVRNHWPGTVSSLLRAGPLVKVRVSLEGMEAAGEARSGHSRASEAGLTALVTRPSLDELGLQPGSPVVASVKATALHVLER